MAEETQQPPKGNLYKLWSSVRGKVNVPDDFSVFEKAMSDGNNLKTFYEGIKGKVNVPPDYNVFEAAMRDGTKPAEKKNESTVSQSPLGGMPSLSASNPFEQKQSEVLGLATEPATQTGLGALQKAPYAKEQKASPIRDKTIPDLTKNKKVQNTLTKFNDIKAAKDSLTSVQGQYDEFLQTGTIDGQRVEGYDPTTGQIVPFSPAAQVKSDLETALNTQKDLTVQKVKDFNKDMPSTKDQIIVDLPKKVGGEAGADILSVQIPAQVQALEFAQKTSDLENKYHELGTDINTALKLSEDIGASSFLDDKQQLLYKALQSKDEKLIDEAMGFIYKDVDDKIADLNKRIISGEGGQDLIDERNDLLTQKGDFLSPAKTLAKIAAIDGSVNAVEEVFKDIHPQDKLRLYYLNSFNDATELAKKLTGQPLFITEGGKSKLNPKVTNYLGNASPQVYYGTQKEDKQKLQDAINIMQLSAPAVLLNKQPIEKGGNFLESVGKTFASTIGLDTGGLGLKKQTEKGSLISNILSEAGINPEEMGKGQGAKLENISKESWGEFGGTTFGYLLGLVHSLAVGAGELKVGKAIASEIGGGAIGRGVRALLALTDKDTTLGRALKLGVEAKLAGATFGDKDNNLGITNIGAESIGSEIIEKALGKTKAGKLAAAVINKMFGKNAGVAFKTIAKANAMGLAETVGETAGTLVQLYQDSPTYTEFIDNVKQQFGDPSEALKFFIATYGLGAVLGGHASPVSKDIDATKKAAYDKLTPEDKEIADKVMAQDDRANDRTILEYVKDNIDKIPDDIKTQQVADLTKAKEELDKAEGEYDIKVGDFNFKGDQSTLEQDKDYVNKLTNEYKAGETETTPTEQAAETNEQQPKPEAGVGVEGGKKSIPNKQQLIDERLDKIVSIKRAAEGTREEQKKRYDELAAEHGDMKAIEMLNKEISERANAEIAKLEPIPTSWYQDVDKKATADFNKITKELGFKDSDMTWSGTPLGDDMGSILVNDSKDAAIYIKPHEEEIYDEIEDVTETISNGIEIEFLNTKGEERGKGKAKQLLEKVIKWADSNNTDLFLTIAPQDKLTTKEGLKKLYEGYGFVFDGIKGVRKAVTETTEKLPKEGKVKETVEKTAQVTEPVTEKQVPSEQKTTEGATPIEANIGEKQNAPKGEGEPTDQNIEEYYDAIEADQNKELSKLRQAVQLKGGETIPYKSSIVHKYFPTRLAPNEFGGHINQKSFIDNADKSHLIGNEKSTKYLRKLIGNEADITEGVNRKRVRDLDELAQEISGDAGIEITEQDIVDYMLDRSKRPEAYLKVPNRTAKTTAKIINSTISNDIETLGKLGTFADDFNIDDPSIQAEVEFLLDKPNIDNLKEYIAHLNLPENADEKREVQKRLQGAREVDNALRNGGRVEEKTVDQRKADFNQKVDSLAEKIKAKLKPAGTENLQKQGIGIDDVVDFIAEVVKEANAVSIDVAEAIKTAKNKLRELGVDDDLINKAEKKYSGIEAAAISDTQIDELLKGGSKRNAVLKDINPELEPIARKITNSIDLNHIKNVLANVDGKYDKQLALLEKKLGFKKIC